MAARANTQAVQREVDLAVSEPHLSRYLFQVEEAERRRLARELHDDTSQGLTLVRYHLGALQEIEGAQAQKQFMTHSRYWIAPSMDFAGS